MPNLNFDLTRLSDRMLNMLTRGAVEQTDGSPVVSAVRDVLLREQVRRDLQEDYEPVALALPSLTLDQVREAHRHLIADTVALESAAKIAEVQGEEQERTELLVACEFLAAVSESLLSPGTGGIV